MTYPDRETRRLNLTILWLAVALIVVVAAILVEASFRNRICESAAMVSATGENWQTPTVCN